MRYFFKITYEWDPAAAGFPAPANGQQWTRGSTVTTGQTKSQVEATFTKSHPHVRAVRAKRGAPIRESLEPFEEQIAKDMTEEAVFKDAVFAAAKK